MVAMNVSEQRAEELANFIRSLQNQGKLDEQFDNLAEVKKNSNAFFFSEVITIFIREAQEALDKITTLLSTRIVDFTKVSETAHILKSCSLTIGGCRLASACEDLYQAAQQIEERRCVAAFDHVQHEYASLHANLIRISRMERAIPGTSNGVGGRRA